MSSKTLDFFHKKKISDFSKNKLIIDELQQQINNWEQKLNNVQLDEYQKQEIEIKIEELQKEKQILTNEEINYYLNTMDLLTMYYTNKSPITHIQNNNKSSNCNINNQSLTLYNTNNFSNKQNQKKQNDLTNFLNKETTINKETIYNEYMFRLNNDISHKKILYADLQKVCQDCGTQQTLDVLKSSYVCEECGKCFFVLLEPEKTTYVKNPLIESCSFSYRRYDHFLEWIAKFHNVDKAKVPKKIYEIVLKELNKTHFKNKTSKKKREVNRECILEILKKTGNSRYNCQVFQIMNVINKKKLPKLPKDIQHKMKQMFKQTQQPFAQICPNNRTNFLSYSYVIRKFLEILEQYEFIQYFPLLKSRDKLWHQDQIWRDICNQLNWKFYPSI